MGKRKSMSQKPSRITPSLVEEKIENKKKLPLLEKIENNKFKDNRSIVETPV